MERGGKEGGLGSMELLGSGDALVLEKGEGMEGEEVGEGESEGEGYLLCKSLFSPLSCSSAATQMMLCFGGRYEDEEAAVMTNGVPRKSSDSSLSTICSSPPSTNITCSSSMASRKLELGGGRGGRKATAATTTSSSVVTSVTSKKTKTVVSARAGTIKVRKEKLGDRISALQQLVSPFGKSDTASVLHEALGYIHFLHEQVQILSYPYLKRLPSSAHLHEDEGGPSRSDLRSRGLCLFPVSCMEHMANSRSNGADLWAPAIGSGNQPFDSEH